VTPTDTDPMPAAPDEVALPAFEDTLWAVLRVEHAAARTSTTTPPETTTDVAGDLGTRPVIVPVDASRRRHRGLRRALAAAAIVAVLAGVGFVASTAGDDPATVAGPAPDPVAPSTEPVPGEPTVEQRAAATMLGQVETTIVMTQVREGGTVVIRTWNDGATRARRQVHYDAAGEPTTDVGPQAVGSEDAPADWWAVDRCGRRYRAMGPALESSLLAFVGGDLESGKAVVVGSEVVDGRALLAVRWWREDVPVALDPATGRWARPDPGQIDPRHLVHLDPETLLPVLVRNDIGGPEDHVVEVTVLPRNDETLTEVVTTVPDGYAEVTAAEWPVARGLASC
jgi:hypothetical protein